MNSPNYSESGPESPGLLAAKKNIEDFKKNLDSIVSCSEDGRFKIITSSTPNGVWLSADDLYNKVSALTNELLLEYSKIKNDNSLENKKIIIGVTRSKLSTLKECVKEIDEKQKKYQQLINENTFFRNIFNKISGFFVQKFDIPEAELLSGAARRNAIKILESNDFFWGSERNIQGEMWQIKNHERHISSMYYEKKTIDNRSTEKHVNPNNSTILKDNTANYSNTVNSNNNNNATTNGKFTLADGTKTDDFWKWHEDNMKNK